jgi:hypothetical protein
MKRLLLGILLVAAAGLAAACGDNGSSDRSDASPTVESRSATPTIVSADEAIALTQDFAVLYKVDNPDGTHRLEQSTIVERVDVLCADEPRWSAEEGEGEWRVAAECKKEEAGTPIPYGFELLRFEWIYYTDLRRVMPVSQAAHDAQYPYPQPSPFPVGTPFSIPPPTVTP